MKRHPDIQLILDQSAKQLAEINWDYGHAYNGKELPGATKLDVKNILENLKSCLDYLAYEIRERYHPDPSAATEKVNFPFANNPSHFRSVVARMVCPDLDKSSPPIYSYLESLNYANTSSQWLKEFNHARNDHTHDGFLDAQVMTRQPMIGVATHGGRGMLASVSPRIKRVVFQNCRVTTPDGTKVIEHLELTDGKVSVADANAEVREFNRMLHTFDGTSVPAHQFLRRSLDGVKSIVAEVAKHI
jgi:hypothetical protein